MINMNDEMKRAWKESYGAGELLNGTMAQASFNAGFNAGVLAERERLKSIIDKKSVKATINPARFVIELYEELFPQLQEQEK